jgi:REP element-mobilizing transposase RayT
MTNLKHYSHKIGMNFWHIEFATKYRYKIFGKFKQRNVAEAHTIFVRPEHVHMLVTLPLNITESKAM